MWMLFNAEVRCVDNTRPELNPQGYISCTHYQNLDWRKRARLEQVPPRIS
jgi:hypothetical protein